MSSRSLTEAASNLDVELDAAFHTSRALRLILFNLEGIGLDEDARRAAAELAFAVEHKLEDARASFDITERYRRTGAPPPVKAART
ncbi:hypothetical protein NS228_06245 [Methylobacterium indicum]|uniref:hypothetical protein n=1 Tax=Methylobacterium indicum TaxID=1775910 RepID=UPI000734E160|nr:hypothetical protein [Methylobacterium indicum]KTS30854.1 hypothetical protein NS229_14585 [Methylobacterium indicum]KTS41558.1 hypothetical protein NS228_06245 [Methylobacterium indicum]KTS45173.1 hypothetical protein NS230_24235 [Methylobacterium indicum]